MKASTNSILAKIAYTADDIRKSVMSLEKSLCVSRTKAEMREYVTAAKERLDNSAERVDGAKNPLGPADNSGNNSLYEDMQDLIGILGQVQYDIMQSDNGSAAKHLHEAMIKIKGY